MEQNINCVFRKCKLLRHTKTKVFNISLYNILLSFCNKKRTWEKYILFSTAKYHINYCLISNLPKVTLQDNKRPDTA